LTQNNFSDNTQPQKKREMLLAMSGVAATVAIVAFDATIVSTVLPKAAQQLNGMSLYAWVGTGYFLASAMTIMIFGRLGDLHGRKPLMLWSLFIVGLGSILSALSQTMPQLIGARVFQGVGAGIMVATAFTAPADLFPEPKERVRWLVMLSATFAVASGLGPLIGGMTEQLFGWRASFFVIPITGALAAYLIVRYFPRLKPERKSSDRIDWLGASLIMLTVGLLLLSLKIFVGHFSAVKPTWGLLTFILCCLSAWALIKVEQRVAMPIFPLRILQTQQAQLLNIAAILCGAVMFILIFYLPLLFQIAFQYSPTKAGVLLIPLVGGIPLGSIASGHLFARTKHPQRLMVFGSAVLGFGCLVALTLTEHSALVWVAIATALCGAGLGFILPNLTLFSQMLAQRQDVGVASALIQTNRALGSAVGTALVGMAITQTSVLIGMRVGLIISIIICAMVMLISARIKMHDYT
jgi:MFS family permease